MAAWSIAWDRATRHDAVDYVHFFDEVPTATQVREVVIERAKSYPKDDTGKPIPGEGPAYTAALTYAEDTFGVGGKSSVDALLYWTRRVAGSEAEAQGAAAYSLLYMHRASDPKTP